MKKRILRTMSAAMLVGALVLNFYVSFADESPACPNGCLDNGGGCTCNGYHPRYLEANES
jgi:hypothetical protein